MAFVNLVSMWIKLPLHIASFLLTSFTIYVQRFEFFTATFAMNVSLGVSIIVFHVGTSRGILDCE
uniref:NADH dehydrogenase subunit 4L n=1 Tax=Romanomermis culicivorax TaxID=13658 RepID=A0A915HUJ9_ROMCU